MDATDGNRKGSSSSNSSNSRSRRRIVSPVIGIDLGALNMKLALVKRGAVDIVLNEQSGRSTPVALAFKNGERFFGKPAKDLATRKPRATLLYLPPLLGAKFGSNSIEPYSSTRYLNAVEDSRRGTYLLHSNGVSVQEVMNSTEQVEGLTPEEAVGMILRYAHNLVKESASDQLVKDTVLVVPPFWTHAQREALMNAADLAGLNVVTLINSGLAFAVKWATEQKAPEKPRLLLVYDMGASSTTATVLQLKAVNETTGKSSKPVTVTVLQSLGAGWDENLGTLEIDECIANYVWNEAVKKGGKSVKELREAASERTNVAVARVLRESAKAKETLSANQETTIQMDGFTDDYDLKVSVERKVIERECASIFARVEAVAEAALAQAKKKKEDLELVEVVGGGVRIPAVKQRLEKFFDRENLDNHINGDEGACFGAALYGATLLSKTFSVKDSTGRSVAVSVSSDDDTIVSEQKVLWEAGKAKLNSRKTLSFHTESNMTLQFDYSSEHGVKQPIVQMDVTGVPNRVTHNYTEDSEPKVTLSVSLAQSGLLSLAKGEAEIKRLVREREKEKESDRAPVGVMKVVTELPEVLREASEREKQDGKGLLWRQSEQLSERTFEKFEVVRVGRVEELSKIGSVEEESKEEAEEGSDETDDEKEGTQDDEGDDQEQSDDSDTTKEEDLKNQDKAADATDGAATSDEAEDSAPKVEGLYFLDAIVADGEHLHVRVRVSSFDRGSKVEAKENTTTSSEQKEADKIEDGAEEVASKEPVVAVEGILTDRGESSALQAFPRQRGWIEKIKTKKVPLHVETTGISITSLSTDRQRLLAAEARNNLEAYCYEQKANVEDGKFDDVTKSAEREEFSAYNRLLLEGLKAAMEWLDDEGFNAPLTKLQDELSKVKTLGDKFFLRLNNKATLPAAMKAVREFLVATRTFLKNIENSHEVSLEEKEEAEKLLEEAESWLETTRAEHKLLSATDDPILTPNAVKAAFENVKAKIRYLIGRPKKKVEKPKPVTIDIPEEAGGSTEEDNEKEVDSTQEESSEDDSSKESSSDGEQEAEGDHSEL